MNPHRYELTMEWTGNQGRGTEKYDAYTRNFTIRAQGKPDLLGSADKTFRGDADRYNPEEMLVIALSSCHMLSYLHVCATNGISVNAYTDQASGSMVLEPGGAGHFTEVTLRPEVTLADASQRAKANELHHEAHEKCFIANSVNFPVNVEPA